MYSYKAYYTILCLPIGVVLAMRSNNLESTPVLFQFHINWLSDSEDYATTRAYIVDLHVKPVLVAM
jgi:hypothetical protein